VTCDPLSYSAGVNVYAYVNNNPFSRWDDYGLYTRSRQARQRKFANCGGQCQGGWLCQTRGSTAAAFNVLGNDILPVFGVRDAVRFMGKVIGGENLSGFRLASDTPMSRMCDLGMPDLLPEMDVKSICGIRTSAEEAREMARAVSGDFGGTNVEYLYNKTSGLTSDVIKCGLHKLGPKSGPVCEVEASIRESLQKKNHVALAVHSGGEIIVNNVLHCFSPDLRDRIHTITCGSGQIIDKWAAKTVVNFVNTSDPVPRAI